MNDEEIKVVASGNTFTVVEDYVAFGVVVPKGFTSNGATLTPIFWTILFVSVFHEAALWLLPLFIFLLRTSFHPKHLTASIVHDYMCVELEEYARADRVFELLMVRSGETRWRIDIKVWGVKAWHFTAYKKDNRPRWWYSMILKGFK